MIFIAQTSAFAPTTSSPNTPSFVRSQSNTQRYNFIKWAGSVIEHWGKTATASHILITPKTWTSQEDAAAQLSDLKVKIDNDPLKFAEYAAQISECPSSAQGGDLGEFTPGRMVANFDKVCFEEEVGVVHGPVSTQFGEHLILITQRTGDKEE